MENLNFVNIHYKRYKLEDLKLVIYLDWATL